MRPSGRLRNTGRSRWGMGSRNFGRDNYYLALLGTPSLTEPCMIQFGGHHPTRRPLSCISDDTKSAFSFQSLRNQIIQDIVFPYYHWENQFDISEGLYIPSPPTNIVARPPGFSL